jgi:hypothetical protein
MRSFCPLPVSSPARAANRQRAETAHIQSPLCMTLSQKDAVKQYFVNTDADLVKTDGPLWDLIHGRQKVHPTQKTANDAHPPTKQVTQTEKDTARTLELQKEQHELESKHKENSESAEAQVEREMALVAKYEGEIRS